MNQDHQLSTPQMALEAHQAKESEQQQEPPECSNLHIHAKRELESLEQGPDDDMQKLMTKQILQLIDVFSSHGHSGFSASYALGLFMRVADFKPLGPLTGKDCEWYDVAEQSGYPLSQNKRCGEVFKCKEETYTINGYVFTDKGEASGYTTMPASKLVITFPHTIVSPIYLTVDKEAGETPESVREAYEKRLARVMRESKDGS